MWLNNSNWSDTFYIGEITCDVNRIENKHVMSPNYFNSKLSILLTVTVTRNAFRENYLKAEKYLQVYVTSVVNPQQNLHTDRI